MKLSLFRVNWRGSGDIFWVFVTFISVLSQNVYSFPYTMRNIMTIIPILQNPPIKVLNVSESFMFSDTG